MTTAGKVIVATIVLVAVAIVGISYATPPGHWEGTVQSFRTPLIMSTITAITHLAAAVLFLMGVGAYDTRLKVAYIAIALGITGTALGTVQLPLLDILDLMRSWWITTGAVALPFLLSGVGVYIGARRYARLVETKTILSKASIVLPGIVVLIAGSFFIPHAPTENAEVTFDASNAIILWTGLFFLAAALIMFRVSQNIGGHYKKATLWLGAGLSASTCVIAVTLTSLLLTGNSLYGDGIIDVTTVAAGAVYMIAGYAFYQTREL